MSSASLRTALLVSAAVAMVATPCQSRSFDWVIVDPLDIVTNPAFLQSALALTADGEPVRARLVRYKATHSLDYLGDFRIEHLSAGGSPVWSGSLQGKVHVEDLLVDSNGAIVVHGSYRDTVWVDEAHHLLDTSGFLRAFLLKIGPDREVEWLFDPGIGDPDFDTVGAIALDPADRVWIGVSYWIHSSAVQRLNADGTVAEEYFQEGVDQISGIAVDPDGTVWVTGPTSSGLQSFHGLEATAPFSYNVYVARYSPSGAGEWARFVEDVTVQHPRIVSDGSGSAYVAGDLNGSFDFGGLTPEGVDWVFDFFLTKLDATGEFLWLQEVPGGVSGDAGRGRGLVVQSSDPSRVWFCGFSRLSVDWGDDGTIPPSFGGRDVLVLEYGADGAFRSAKTAGGPGFDIADAVAVDADGNVFIAGQVGEGASFDGQVFAGNFTNSFLASLPAEQTAGVEDGATNFDALSIKSHPNPFRPSTQIRFRLEHAGPVRLAIYGPSGARIATLADRHLDSGPHVLRWDGRDDQGNRVPSGIYLYKLDTSVSTATGRVTLLR